MSARNSTRTATKSKPERPEGAVLFWHPSGRWCKKIRGKQHYFGNGTYDEAKAEYDDQAEDLHAGRTPADTTSGQTINQLAREFLAKKKAERDSGELSVHTYNDYTIACRLFVKFFGRNNLVAELRPDDFARVRARMGKTWGLVRVANMVTKFKTIFNFGVMKWRIPEPHYGGCFDAPSKRKLTEQRQAQGERMFEAFEIRAMIEGALVVGKEGPELVTPTVGLRAMLLLGINCGFGNNDVATLPLAALDLDAGWVKYPRPKTHVPRRVPLWSETVQAIREWLKVRPKPIKDEHRGLVFITAKGGSFAKDTPDNPVSKETAKLLHALGINGHRGFYALRHSFQTIGDECGDFIAVRKIMGHKSSDIADVYRERISDERLQKVTEHVRRWLWPHGN